MEGALPGLLLALLAALSGCSEEPSGESEQPAAPTELRRYRYPLFERLNEFEAREGLPNASTRFLSLGQDPHRNQAYDRLRMLGPVAGCFAGPEMRIPPGAELELDVGLDWLDALVPQEGAGGELQAVDPIVQVFELAWSEGGTEEALEPRAEVRLESGVDRRRSSLQIDLGPLAGRQGRLLFRTHRREGPVDLRVLPCWWGPRLVVRAARAPEVFLGPDAEHVVCDLLAPRLDPRVVLADGSSPALAAPELPRVVRSVLRGPEGEPSRQEAPLVGIEAHFGPGHALDVPRGGVRPAYTFAADAVLALELPPEASGGELCFELGFAEEFGRVLAPAAVELELRLDGEPLHRLLHEAPLDPREQGWSPGHSVPLPDFEPDAPPILSLVVRFRPFEAVVEAVEGADGVRRERTLLRPQLGVGRPRVRRALDVEPARATPEDPSVLVVSIETLRADVLGAQADGHSRTPVLDGWSARRGLVFERAYSPSSWTLPSVASLLTGLAPHEHWAVDEEADLLGEWTWTLAEAARERGVATAGFFSNELMRRETGFAAGFETFVCAQTANAMQMRLGLESWLDRQDGRRFYAHVHLFDPHDPYNAPGDLRHADVGAAGRAHPYAMSVATVRAAMRDRMDVSEQAEELAYLRGRYLGEVRFLDRQLGALLARLDDRGLLATTRVVLVADHGEEFGEHEWFGHGSQLFEETVHVPLVVFGPGVEPGRVRAPVGTLAVAGRVARDLGLEPPVPALPLTPASPPAPGPVRVATNKGIDLTSEPRHVSVLQRPGRLQKRPLRAVIDGTRKAVLRLSRLPTPADLDGRGGLRLAPLVEHLQWFDLAEDPAEQAGSRGSWDEAPAWAREALEAWLLEEATGIRGLSTDRLSPSTRKILENLGYVQGGAGRAPDEGSSEGAAEDRRGDEDRQ